MQNEMHNDVLQIFEFKFQLNFSLVALLPEQYRMGSLSGSYPAGYSRESRVEDVAGK